MLGYTNQFLPGIRALLSLWEARNEQARSEEPSIDAALLLFHAILVAQDGDGILEYERRRELQGLQDLDTARHDFDVYIHGRRSELVKAGYLSHRENPIVDARLGVLEALKQSEIEKARQAVTEERRQRSSKGGAAVAKHYAENREKLIDQFKASFGQYSSIAAAAAALGRANNFSERTAEEHLRRFVADNPHFRPKRST